MRYLSLCSGIEAASVAWHPLGWQPLAFAEIDPFCCAVLAQRFPDVPNLGDITALKGADIVARHGAPDVVVAGTPCQSFSVAGKRLGLEDPRGNVTLHFLRLVSEIRPEWVVWENVPGVLSIDGGRTFRQILRTVDECGYGVAWRVLDAQHFGVPQRRRRVFLVGCRGDWRRAAQVLFEPESRSGSVEAGCEARKADPGAGGDSVAAARVAGTVEANYSRMFSGSDFENLIAGTVASKWHKGAGGPSGDECQNLLAVQESSASAQAVVFETRMVRNGRGTPEDVCPPLKAQSGTSGSGDSAPMVVFSTSIVRKLASVSNVARTLTSTAESRPGDNSQQIVFEAANRLWTVRRFTPLECERLQGFPDDWTMIKWRGKPASNTQRYKAVGNSMAVPVVRWIGRRIAEAAAL